MIPFQRPSFPTAAAIDRYFDLAREERWFSNGGPCWRLLRDRLGERVGAYCVPVASGTQGLMVALATVLGESGGRGRRALMPSFTFVATAQAAMWTGLEPALCDIAADHWQLDPTLLERALAETADVAAVVAVSAFGTPPPPEVREGWEQTCRAAGVPLVVDSAAGFGAVAGDGVPVGAQGDVEVVSFHATKPFGIGEGGAIFTRDRDLRDRLELAINFGFRGDRSIGFPRGLNAKMSELHSATALAVLDEIDRSLERRRTTAATLRARAGSGVSWQRGAEFSTWQFTPVAVAGPEERQRLLDSCAGRAEVRVYYEPLHALLPESSLALAGGLAETERLHSRILCLPMANDVDAAELETICALLEAA